MHDVFISYSHKDVQIADAICHKFEEAGIRCWYAPRNIRPGDEWASAIIKALEECKAMILVFTDASNLSVQVHREVDAAVGSGKTIIPFKCSETEPSGSMRYYLSTLHWMDALTEPMDTSIGNLLQFTKRVVMEGQEFEAGTEKQTSLAAGTANAGSPANRKKIVWILAAACILLAVVTAAALFSKNKNGVSTASNDVPAEQTVSAGSAEPVPESTVSEAESAENSEALSESDAGKAEDGAEDSSRMSESADTSPDSPGAENYLYTLTESDTEVRLDRYFGPEDAKIVIPEIIDGLPVTWIGEKCFEDHDYIEELVLPDTMDFIGYRAFYGCTNLKEMNIPASLKHFGGWSFAHCGFVNMTLPDTFEALDYGAFYGNDELETVILPASVDWIGENTFRMCPKLVSVTMPAPEPEINANAFEPDTDVTIIGIPGSYTEKYAKGMGLKFKAYQG